MKLIIGNKNYSTWSLRAWLVLHAFNVEFEEIKIPLFSQQARDLLANYPSNGKVPVLVDDTGLVNDGFNADVQDVKIVWDSLAIAQYISKYVPEVWGQHPNIAMSLACEMHSSFAALRNEMPMNIKAKRKITLTEAGLKDVQRIKDIFSTYRQQFKNEGDYLLGQFSIADACFAPVVFRFLSYAEHANFELDDISQSYCDTLLQHPSMQLWHADALAEPSNDLWTISGDEVGQPA